MQHLPIPLKLHVSADIKANLARQEAMEQMLQVSKRDPIPVPLKAQEQGSLLPATTFALTVLASKGPQEQDSDIFASSS